MKVQPVNCVATYRIMSNITQNLDNTKKWNIKWLEDTLLPTKEKAIIASAGPSLKTHLKEIKKKQKAGYSVFCVKHALPTLKEGGIVPDGLVILDPRPVTGTSTHGFLRTELFDSLDKSTVVYAASMTHPSVVEYCVKNGNKIVGWHALMKEVEMLTEYYQREFPQAPQRQLHVVGGGTCSGVRAVLLLQSLGYAKVEMVGFDFEYRPEKGEDFKEFIKNFSKDILKKHPLWKAQLHPDGGIAAVFNEKGTPKYARGNYDKYEYWASGELIAGVQDLDSLFRQVHSLKIKVEVWPDCGMSSIVYNVLKKDMSVQPSRSLKQFLES